MANAVFTTQPEPSYDDIREIRYHFPSRYLTAALQTVNDWILYYEPRRPSAGSTLATGRQAYIAMAFVERVGPDPARSDHHYAYLRDYIEFPSPVPFRIGENYPEKALRKTDGSTNRGVFGWNLRLLPADDFQVIYRLGMAPAIADVESGGVQGEELRVAETQSEYAGPRRNALSSRPVRDAAFGRLVADAYNQTCAMTGLNLTHNGKHEIHAAHIRSVEAEGPDSPRNGIALSRTVHWLFDQHLLAIGDRGEILVAEKFVPAKVKQLLNPNRQLIVPKSTAFAPHPFFVQFHRNKFKG